MVNFLAVTHRSIGRLRADILLVERGLARTRSQAQDLIRQRRVSVRGTQVDKPGTLVDSDATVEIRPGRDFVSRGGQKLDAALDELGVDVCDKVVADIGASTGGFTDCVLQRGARKVYAIDVGHDQLDARLLKDPRVVSWEGTNARDLTADRFTEPVDVVVVDASFISLSKLTPALSRILPKKGELVALVKPQFEVGRVAAKKSRGVVRDPDQRARSIADARSALERAGFRIVGACDSAVAGPKGNVEHFVYAVRV